MTIKSYLGPNEDRILTDYRIILEQLTAGTLPLTTGKTTDRAQPLTLTVYGSDLTLEGVLLSAGNPNCDEIVEGRSYLLFLAHSRTRRLGIVRDPQWRYFRGVRRYSEAALKAGRRNIQGYGWFSTRRSNSGSQDCRSQAAALDLR